MWRSEKKCGFLSFWCFKHLLYYEEYLVNFKNPSPFSQIHCKNVVNPIIEWNILNQIGFQYQYLKNDALFFTRKHGIWSFLDRLGNLHFNIFRFYAVRSTKPIYPQSGSRIIMDCERPAPRTFVVCITNQY